MSNTAKYLQCQENKNASTVYANYSVTSAVTLVAATANMILQTLYNNTTGIIYVVKGTTGATSFSTDGKSIAMTSAVFNPLSLDPWTGAIYIQSTTGATNSLTVETIYTTWMST